MKDSLLTVVSQESVRTEYFLSLLSSSPYTVLYFYPKDDTPGCSVEAQEFSLLYQDFLSKNVAVFGVSKDGEQSHCRFVEKFSLAIPLIADTDLVLHDYFGTLSDRTMYGKVYRGTVRTTFVLGRVGNIVHEWRDVRAAGHAKQVYDFVCSLPSL